MKMAVDPFNATHDGKIVLDFSEDITAAYVKRNSFHNNFNNELVSTFQLEFSAVLSDNDTNLNSQGTRLMNTKVNACNLFSKKRLNFMLNFFFEHLMKNLNQDLRKCPLKKV